MTFLPCSGQKPQISFDSPSKYIQNLTPPAAIIMPLPPGPLSTQFLCTPSTPTKQPRRGAQALPMLRQPHSAPTASLTLFQPCSHSVPPASPSLFPPCPHSLPAAPPPRCFSSYPGPCLPSALARGAPPHQARPSQKWPGGSIFPGPDLPCPLMRLHTALPHCPCMFILLAHATVSLQDFLPRRTSSRPSCPS